MLLDENRCKQSPMLLASQNSVTSHDFLLVPCNQLSPSSFFYKMSTVYLNLKPVKFHSSWSENAEVAFMDNSWRTLVSVSPFLSPGLQMLLFRQEVVIHHTLNNLRRLRQKNKLQWIRCGGERFSSDSRAPILWDPYSGSSSPGPKGSLTAQNWSGCTSFSKSLLTNLKQDFIFHFHTFLRH